jgi:hypothetical protein
MAEFGNKDFWSSLGQYVYGYKNPETNEWLYIGKGNDNRGSAHVKPKGYDINNLYIIARNLELFENKKDWQSFLLETFLIEANNPSDNRASGHYKECFIMSRFSTLFKDYKDGQYDNFQELPQWYIENYSKLKGRINVLSVKSGNTYIQGQTRNSMEMRFYVDAISDQVTQVNFSIWDAKGVNLEESADALVLILKESGYDDVSETGNRKAHKIFEINETDVQKVIELFDEFYS